MPAEHIYDAAHPISHEVLRKHGPQRHIFFSTEFSNAPYNAPHERRSYSQKEFEQVQELLEELRITENQRSSLYDITHDLEDAIEFIVERKQAHHVDPDDSECDVEFYKPSGKQLLNVADKASKYLAGISKIDLYAALSGRESDRQFAERGLKRKITELKTSLNENQRKIDGIYNQIMAVPLINPEQTKDKPKRRFWDFLMRKKA